MNTVTLIKSTLSCQYPKKGTPAGILVESLRKKAGAESLPTYEEVFASSIRQGLTMVPFKQLAVFNNPQEVGAFTKKGARKQRLSIADQAVIEMAPDTGVQNILNPFAEVDPGRVAEILGSIIRGRKMYQPIMVFDNLSTSAQGSPNFQIFSGRNRAAALALLFGTDISVPVWFDSEPHVRATTATLESNDCRGRRNLEREAVIGLQLRSGKPSPEEQFRAINGRKEALAHWVIDHTRCERTRLFRRFSVPVTEGIIPGVFTMPVVVYRDILKRSMAVLCGELRDRRNFGYVLGVTNKVLEALEILHAELPRYDTGRDLSAYYSNYAAQAIGTLLGERLAAGSTPEMAGVALASTLSAFAASRGHDVLTRTPIATLMGELSSFTAKRAAVA